MTRHPPTPVRTPSLLPRTMGHTRRLRDGKVSSGDGNTGLRRRGRPHEVNLTRIRWSSKIRGVLPGSLERRLFRIESTCSHAAHTPENTGVQIAPVQPFD